MRTVRGLAAWLALFLIAAGPALAGAWTLAKGEGIAITTAFLARADEGFGTARRRAPVPRFRKAEIQTLVEYGLADGFTLRGRTEWQRIRTGGPFPFERTGLGFSEVGARLRLFQKGAFVASAESSVRVAEAHEGRGPGFLGDYEAEVDARLLAGYAFDLRGWPSFVDLQAAYRTGGGERPDEVRADVTLGVRPRARTLVLAQFFSTVALAGRGFGLGDYDHHKLQLSAVQDLSRRFAVQAGGYATLAGRNAPDERGLLLALWYRF